MARSSKKHFDHSFLICYITYKLIIMVEHIWLRTQPYKIYIIKIKKLIVKLLVKDRKFWILVCMYTLQLWKERVSYSLGGYLDFDYT